MERTQEQLIDLKENLSNMEVLSLLTFFSNRDADKDYEGMALISEEIESRIEHGGKGYAEL